MIQSSLLYRSNGKAGGTWAAGGAGHQQAVRVPQGKTGWRLSRWCLPAPQFCFWQTLWLTYANLSLQICKKLHWVLLKHLLTANITTRLLGVGISNSASSENADLTWYGCIGWWAGHPHSGPTDHLLEAHGALVYVHENVIFSYSTWR